MKKHKLPADLEKQIQEIAKEYSGHEPTQVCCKYGAEALWGILADPCIELKYWIYPEPDQNRHAFSAKVYDRWSGTGEAIETVGVRALAVANGKVAQLNTWRKQDEENFNSSAARLSRRINEVEAQLAISVKNDEFNRTLIDEKDRLISDLQIQLREKALESEAFHSRFEAADREAGRLLEKLSHASRPTPNELAVAELVKTNQALSKTIAAITADRNELIKIVNRYHWIESEVSPGLFQVIISGLSNPIDYSRTKNFNEKLTEQRFHLKRHFRGSFRRWLAGKILGSVAVANLIYDAANVGWGIGYHEKENNL